MSLDVERCQQLELQSDYLARRVTVGTISEPTDSVASIPRWMGLDPVVRQVVPFLGRDKPEFARIRHRGGRLVRPMC